MENKSVKILQECNRFIYREGRDIPFFFDIFFRFLLVFFFFFFFLSFLRLYVISSVYGYVVLPARKHAS